MEIKKYEIVLHADTPIAHMQETFGNVGVIFRRKLRQPDGSFAQVPFITGDSLRHGMREAIAYAYLDAAGLLAPGVLDDGEGALRLLFSGGMVTGVGDASVIKLDRYREMCSLCPALSLFGGCADNRPMEGRLIVDDAVLICAESAHLVPAWARERAGQIDGARSHVEINQRVRMDPTLDPSKRRLLSDAAASEVHNRLLASEAAHETDDAVTREHTKSTMMPRSFESIVSGSLFFWTVEAKVFTPLELDVFHATLASFLSNAHAGGKRAVGFGRISAVAAKGVAVNRPKERLSDVDMSAIAPRVGEMFRAHVQERAAAIKTFLSGTNA